MKHQYLDNMPLEEAREKYLELLKNNGFSYKTEIIPAALSFGRVSARAHYAKICSPHYNASSMDGIAVNSEDTYGATEREPAVLSRDSFTPVDTGDPLPEGKDAVIMIEDVIFTDDGCAKIYSAARPFMNVRQIGEDICMGDMLIPSFSEITPTLAGALLAGGNINAEVIKKPVFGIIPTGDEIVSPKEEPEKGEILEFNSTVFSGMLSSFGAEGKIYPIIPDKKELIKATLEKAVRECDAVLILAGSSAGRDDYTCDIIKSLGSVLVHGIAVKPGKPAVLGAVGSIPVIGLPGYPVSAVVIMNEIVRYVADGWYNRGKSSVSKVKAKLGRKVVSSLKYEEFIRVTLGKVADTIAAVPISGGAGVITSFTKADGILRVPQNLEGINAGEEVEIELLKDFDKIENSLIVTGSHDPIIDEISDIMKRMGEGLSLTSTHLGSMGAITALKSSTAHLGAVHLLDENTGEYNKSYINKYFPEGGVKLVKGVKRVQGLMVQKGNPLGIKDFSDIVKGTYINRQGGSGTRVLCEWLVKKYGIDKDAVKGYYNEEFTHTAVAAGIKNGNADVGLGIYSAAKMYDLDFIPVCNEEYDFIVSEKAAENENVKLFFEILVSDEFRNRLEKLGGYGV
ncbi:MAG: molybdopterin biosynthesis protein [Ruminococcaceae bacterium]|nr:molybdopterin biosynthesis protein [Oscillospiraceae bacterium]MBR3595405.1 molybdopterin biosynthesis protein [Clostridia bacterium]